jgi:arylsulfatase A-like enzyme/Tfp pilus assembly protein PilF
VTIDTLRFDHVSASGREGSPATPHFDRLAVEGVLFEQAVAPVPLTLPSHASILTGQWPFRHGVRDNGGFRLPDPVPTLAEVLRARGYRTAAFVGAFVLDSRFGLDRGFETYDDEMPAAQGARSGEPGTPHGHGGYLGDARRSGEAVARAAAAWISGSGDEPIFVWVHLFDPHAPYEPSREFRDRYPGRPYAAAVAQADAALGIVLEALERRHAAGGVGDRGAERGSGIRPGGAVVAVAGDHGESLGEHGEAAHGVFLYDATLRVPLVLRGPGLLPGTRIGWQARLVDLAPTLLALAMPFTLEVSGLSAPGAQALAPGGIDLTPLIRGEIPSPDLPAYAESLFGTYHYGWSPLRAVREQNRKWIEAPRPELYDLEHDPAETRNLWDSSAGEGRALAERLRSMAGPSAAPPAPAAEDPETLARLRALGYVGAGAAPAVGQTSGGGSDALVDPKDGILQHTRFEAGFGEAARRFDAGDYAGAAETAGALLREFPQARDARRLRAIAMLNQGNDAEAGRELARLIAEDGADSVAHAATGRILERRGERQAALAAYARALASGPERADLRLRRGRLSRLEGRLEEAEQELETALRVDPALSAAVFERALVALARGDHAAALPLLERAAAAQPPPRGAHHNLALLYEEKGDLEAARRAYEGEIQAHPDAAASHLNLGLLLERLGDAKGSLRHLEAAAAARPPDPRALTALASALTRATGGASGAVRARALLQQALRLEPGYTPARDLLARLSERH